MQKGKIAKASDSMLAERWLELDTGASEEFEGEMSRIEREQDDRHFDRMHGIEEGGDGLGDPWWAHP